MLAGAIIRPPVARAAYPPLPLADDGRFLAIGPAGPVAPGGSTDLPFNLSDPLSVPIDSVVLTFSLYAFNAYPGNSSGPLPGQNAPSLSNSTSTATSVEDRWAALSAGVRVSSASSPLTFAAPSQAGEGTYAIRTTLSFVANGSAYRLESIGNFPAAVWESATGGSSGTYNASTLNLTKLGVSGVLPETAVLVRSNPYSVPLYVLVGVGLVLAGAGSYYAVRRGPGSKSGAVGSPDDHSAPSAFGNKRTSDGD